MLSPEVVKFSPPDHFIEVNNGNLNSEKSDFFVKKKINSHYFNNLISIVLPETKNNPQEFSKILKDSDSYLIKSIPLSVFINRQFIEGFIKRGNFYALSQNTNIDTDECVAITPCGILFISLNKETFQTLGIEGKISVFSKKNRERYSIPDTSLGYFYKLDWRMMLRNN